MKCLGAAWMKPQIQKLRCKLILNSFLKFVQDLHPAYMHPDTLQLPLGRQKPQQAMPCTRIFWQCESRLNHKKVSCRADTPRASWRSSLPKVERFWKNELPNSYPVSTQKDEDSLEKENKQLSGNVHPLLLEVLEATILKPHNQYTPKWHDMEESYLKKCFEDSLRSQRQTLWNQDTANPACWKTCKSEAAGKISKRERHLLKRLVRADYDESEAVCQRFIAFDPKVLCFILLIMKLFSFWSLPIIAKPWWRCDFSQKRLLVACIESSSISPQKSRKHTGELSSSYSKALWNGLTDHLAMSQ